MVKTQISHPTSSPLISGFDWHTPLFFFSLSPPRLFLMLLAVPVSLCDNREPATLSMFAAASLNPLSLFSPSLSPPPLSRSLSLSQDEGPQHLISTSAVKVQRLLALLHIMKEGWSLDPAGNPPKDWVTERGIPELFYFSFLFFFLRKCLFFPCFALASVEEDFLQRPTFCCCFLDMMGKKKKTFIDSLCSKHAYWHRI